MIEKSWSFHTVWSHQWGLFILKKYIRILHIMHCICMIFFFFFLQPKFTGLIFKNYGETMTLPCKMGPLLLWDITPLVNILNFCIQYITSNAKMHWKHTFLVFCNEKSLSYYKLCCQRLGSTMSWSKFTWI